MNCFLRAESDLEIVDCGAWFYAAHRGDSPEELVHAVMINTDLWGMDLTSVEGFEAATVRILKTIRTEGALQAFRWAPGSQPARKAMRHRPSKNII